MEPTLSSFDYDLPGELIAQVPAQYRDGSRLLRLDRASGRIEHHLFQDLPTLLRDSDLLVLNDTRVIPAFLACRRKTGARIEGLFLRTLDDDRWEVLIRNAGRCSAREEILFENAPDRGLLLEKSLGQGRWIVRPNPAGEAEQILENVGTTPLPPYIRREDRQRPEDRDRYQTVYARRPGAVAAPTAGLHFTQQVFERLGQKGIQTAVVTLHVGLGTFAPVQEEDLSEHTMHSEWFELSGEAAKSVSKARSDGRRIVAVGTTAVRVLESVAAAHKGDIIPTSGHTDLFIRPPADFAVVNALITNFHLPRSTLLMLIAAFCDPGGIEGIEAILGAYAEAVTEKYRFYSYGDAMLIE